MKKNKAAAPFFFIKSSNQFSTFHNTYANENPKRHDVVSARVDNPPKSNALCRRCCKGRHEKSDPSKWCTKLRIGMNCRVMRHDPPNVEKRQCTCSVHFQINSKSQYLQLNHP